MVMDHFSRGQLEIPHWPNLWSPATSGGHTLVSIIHFGLSNVGS
jgi:hypothetical protein